MFQTAPQAQTVTVIPGDGVSPELTAPQAQTVTVIPGDGVSPELTAPQAQTVTVIPGDGVSPELTAPQAQTVTVIPGDGVSPELVRAMRDVFRDCGIPVQFEEVFVSEIDPDRSASVDDLVASVKKNNGICIKGVTQSVFRTESGELQSTNTKMRRALDLFANVVHVKSIPGLETRHTGHDFYVIREQTEGEYSAIEHESVPGVVESLKIVTRDKCTRIAKFAFNFATKHGRKRVTAVHKANIMKLGDGLFLRCCDEVSKLYPKIEFSNMIIDNCCMQLVSRPQQFDVMVMGNLYGNIVDNLAAGLVGGAGVVPGMSFGMDTVIFEQGARHTFQASIGLDRANPTAMLLCAANMIEIVSEETKAWEIIALFVTYLLLN